MMPSNPTLVLVGITVAALELSGCERTPSPQVRDGAPPLADTAASRGETQWSSQVSGAGIALVLVDAANAPVLRIACTRDPAVLKVVAEPFHAIGSEERLSFGIDAEPFVFVADPMAGRPSGVEAEAPVTEDVLERFAQAREVSAVYGAQRLGPYAAPDSESRGRFVTTCRQLAGLTQN